MSDSPAVHGPPALRLLDMPGRLLVPCRGVAKPAGTVVRQGEAICVESGRCPSPVDGRVTGTARRILLGGREVETVIVEKEGNSAPLAIERPNADQVRQALRVLPDAASKNFASELAAHGIQADRWTSPDLETQLSQAARQEVDVVLCGALDLDPVLPLQQELCRAHAMELATGVMGLARITGAARGVIVLPEDSPAKAVAAMKAASTATSARLYPLPDEYPLAQPSLLLRRVLGRKLKPGGLPTEVGAIVLDAPAAVALGQFFLTRRPMLTTPFGLYDRGRHRAHVVRVTIGTRLADALATLGVPSSQSELRVGQYLRDVRTEADAIIGNAELTVVASEPAAGTPASACLRCGWCVEACPSRIHPAGLLEASQQEDLELADRYGVQSCIECGICSYVCPSRLPLLQAIRLLRDG